MFQKTVGDSVLLFTSVFSDPFWTFNELRVALRLLLEPTESSDFTFGPNRGKWGRPIFAHDVRHFCSYSFHCRQFWMGKGSHQHAPYVESEKPQ